MTKADRELAEWLLLNGNPIIRYRTARELVRGFPGSKLKRLESELLTSKPVAYWLDCIPDRIDARSIHGSFDGCLENSLGKLVQFGLRAGMRLLDERVRPCLSWLNGLKSDKTEDVIPIFYISLVSSLLASAGFGDRKEVRSRILRRLNRVHEFTRKGKFDIYAKEGEFKGIPAAFRGRPLIDPALYPDGDFGLPWIYDLYAFAELSTQKKLESVLSYVLNPRYQRIPHDYGIIRENSNRYYSMGWAVWLPRLPGRKVNDFETGGMIQRLDLMSRFRTARSSPWFVRCIKHLEGFRTNRGTYRFPAEYLKERKNTYWITGGHMGLGENRRKRLAREIESTFWMLRIRSRCR
jgi:hypothetical protein